MYLKLPAKLDDGKRDGKTCSTPEMKVRRQLGLWNAKDINNFFKALSEVSKKLDNVIFVFY